MGIFGLGEFVQYTASWLKLCDYFFNFHCLYNRFSFTKLMLLLINCVPHLENIQYPFYSLSLSPLCTSYVKVGLVIRSVPCWVTFLSDFYLICRSQFGFHIDGISFDILSALSHLILIVFLCDVLSTLVLWVILYNLRSRQIE